MEIALWGYYGSNYGDDIMLNVLLDYFYKKKAKVLLIQGYNDHLEYKLSNKYDNVTVIPFRKLSRKNKLRIVMKLAKVKINLWGGGTIFTDQDGDGNYKFFSLIKYFGGKIGYVGVGIGNLSKKNRIKKTKKLLSWSSLTVFRDETSYKRANELVKDRKYFIAEDLSYIFFEEYNHGEKNSNQDYILLTWRNLNGYLPLQQELQLMRATVDVIKSIIEKRKNTRVKLVALDTKQDIDSCRLLSELFRSVNINAEFDIDSSISNITDLIINSFIHFSGRLHGSVASEFFGVNTVTLAYSPKQEHFYSSIDSQNYIDIYSDKINIENVERVLQKNITSINTDKMKSEANLNFEYLDTILK